jgi:hypothetical protein
MVQVNEPDRGAKSYSLRQRRQLAHHQFGGWHHVDCTDVRRLGVMLADVCVAKAQLIGQHDFGNVLLVGTPNSGSGALPEPIREDAEFHLKARLIRKVAPRTRAAARFSYSEIGDSSKAKRAIRSSISPLPRGKFRIARAIERAVRELAISLRETANARTVAVLSESDGMAHRRLDVPLPAPTLAT